MWIFIILSLTDIYIFWRLAGDLKHRSKALRAVVFTVKAIQSLILLWFIVTMLSYKGEFADPANAYRYIVFGALAGLIFTVGSLYLVNRHWHRPAWKNTAPETQRTGDYKLNHLRSAVVTLYRQLCQAAF